MGDIGLADQLTSARGENKVLTAKVKELADQMKSLRLVNETLVIQNQALLAEVEEYRREAALPNFSKMSLQETKDRTDDQYFKDEDHFVRSGNGIFPSNAVATLSNLHGASNPLCCNLHPDDSLLVTGGADSILTLCPWGVALAPHDDASTHAVKNAARVHCSAPVISSAFATHQRGRAMPILAAGCMDGSVKFAGYDHSNQKLTLQLLNTQQLEKDTRAAKAAPIKHGKYVKYVVWSPSEPILASASADGTVRLTKVLSTSWGNTDEVLSAMSMDEEKNYDLMDDEDDNSNNQKEIITEHILTLYLSGPVEAMTFLNNGDILCCYARGASYLSYFDLRDNCKLMKYSINGGAYSKRR